MLARNHQAAHRGRDACAIVKVRGARRPALRSHRSAAEIRERGVRAIVMMGENASFEAALRAPSFVEVIR